MKYYSTEKIDKKNATYNVIFGERSNGKTYCLLLKGVKEYIKTGKQLAYVRRWKEDITGRRGSRLYAGLIENGEIEKVTDGEFKGVHYYAGKFYLCNYNESGKAVYSDQDVIAYAFSLSDGEHDKSNSFPNIGLIVFDEFLTNKLYLNDEFVLFMNTVSTIVRRREDVKIYMLGNTVNRFAPYFVEMGLTHVQKMKQGSIDVYHYGNSELKVAVEHCSETVTTKQQNKYFAFNNPKLEMITSGVWELDIYPHLPSKYTPKDVLLDYFIIFNDNIFHCSVIDNGDVFTYIHKKTTPLKDENIDLVYDLKHNPKRNYNRSVLKPTSKVQSKIAWFFKNDKVFYQDNEVGDTINNYIKICRSL